MSDESCFQLGENMKLENSSNWSTENSILFHTVLLLVVTGCEKVCVCVSSEYNYDYWTDFFFLGPYIHMNEPHFKHIFWKRVQQQDIVNSSIVNSSLVNSSLVNINSTKRPSFSFLHLAVVRPATWFKYHIHAVTTNVTESDVQSTLLKKKTHVKGKDVLAFYAPQHKTHGKWQ
jgi:hypothetical protein